MNSIGLKSLSLNPGSSLASQARGLKTSGQTRSFGSMLAEQSSLIGRLVGEKPFAELGQMKTKALQNAKLSARDLILYQIKAAEFGLGVELVSKVAESVSVTVRKFQNNQS